MHIAGAQNPAEKLNLEYQI